MSFRHGANFAAACSAAVPRLRRFATFFLNPSLTLLILCHVVKILLLFFSSAAAISTLQIPHCNYKILFSIPNFLFSLSFFLYLISTDVHAKPRKECKEGDCRDLSGRSLCNTLALLLVLDGPKCRLNEG